MSPLQTAWKFWFRGFEFEKRGCRVDIESLRCGVCQQQEHAARIGTSASNVTFLIVVRGTH